MQSRLAKEVSPTTIRFYQVKMGRLFHAIYPDNAEQHHIERFLLQFRNPGNRHRYYQVIKTFYIWREQVFGFPNPIKHIPAPRLGKLILPSLTKEQVDTILCQTQTVRDKAIAALFTESGLRLSELASIRPQDIDWNAHTIKVIGKGRKEAYAPFGELSGRYLREWLAQYNPNGNIWGMNEWGIVSMLRRLGEKTGLPCNPHTFRRTFACLLRKQGLDVLTIKDLGRWESLEMVQRYTRSVTFQDSLKFYKGVLY
jgi:integrase